MDLESSFRRGLWPPVSDSISIFSENGADRTVCAVGRSVADWAIE